MSGESLSISSERQGGVYRINTVGELDIATASSLERSLLDIDEADRMIVLDLSGLSFIDSTGLRVVVELNRRYGGEIDRLRIVAESRAVERLLDLVGLRAQLPLITSDQVPLLIR